MFLHKISAFILLCGSALAQAPPNITVVSAATGDAPVAVDSLVVLFGSNLTDRIEQATTLPLPTTLAGISVQVMNQPAGLLFAAPGQINFVMPSGVVLGNASVTVMKGAAIVAQGTVQVQSIAPGLFFVGTSHIAAANAARHVGGAGPLVVFPTFSCDPAVTICTAVALDVGIDSPLTLELYGTGIRRGSHVTATIGGQTMPVSFAGAQSQFPGLDQVNIGLLLTLRGSGRTNIVVTVDGIPSNPVEVRIQ
jgi:uncharacterized protein (TIGR03437 family)